VGWLAASSAAATETSAAYAKGNMARRKQVAPTVASSLDCAGVDLESSIALSATVVREPEDALGLSQGTGGALRMQ
jgi:hypothetical protein